MTNHRTWFSTIWLLSLAFIAPTSLLATPTAQADIEKLRGQYSIGSIYLTYLSLYTFGQHLRDEEVASALKALGVSSGAITRLKDYLARATPSRQDLSTSTAFLRIDLNSFSAYEKRANELDSRIAKLDWSPDLVKEIAIICDKLYAGEVKVRVEINQVRANKRTVADAWQQIETLRKDPFIPRGSLSVLTQASADLMEKNPQQLEQIKKADTGLYKEIVAFREEISKNSTSATIPLWTGNYAWTASDSNVVPFAYLVPKRKSAYDLPALASFYKAKNMKYGGGTTGKEFVIETWAAIDKGNSSKYDP